MSSLTVSAATLDDQSPLSTEVQCVSASLVQLAITMEAVQAKCTPSLPYRLVLRMFKLLAIYISIRHPDSRYNVIVAGIEVNPVGTVCSAHVA